MNLNEARKILWLRNNPRPLGELLDEGYLTESRLEWAAKRAYDPNLKQATQVIIESLKNPSRSGKTNEKNVDIKVQTSGSSLPIGMSLEKARANLWPFLPYKGQPMGTLVDSKQLTLKDLGYAIEAAWDEKVRQAAIALTLIRLEQVVKEPAPSAGVIRLIKPERTYSQRRQNRLTLIEGFLYGGFIAFLLSLLIIITIEFLKPNSNNHSITDFISSPYDFFLLLGGLVILILLCWLPTYLFNLISIKLDKEIEEYRLGEEGEDRVVQLIIQTLDGRWSVFQNISLPGRNKGDLDIVLVGPPGVWVLEVKNFQGEYRNIGDTWEYHHGKNWKTAKANPSRQVLNNALRLKNFLMADHLNLFVNPVVLWANEEIPLLLENPSTPIWLYNRLPDELGNIWQGEKISEAERQKITEKLQKLIQAEEK